MADATGANGQGPSYRLVYRSHSLIPAAQRDVELASIFRTARSRNKTAQITGALLITDHLFVQALEGEQAAVRALFERISADPRHDQVSVVSAEDVPTRVFGRWAMAQISASGHADIPLHAAAGTIHPSAGGPSTREQDAVLATMRAVIGADTV
jgi:hypothetical protein